MTDRVLDGVIHTGSEVTIGYNSDGKEVLAIGFVRNYNRNIIVVDRATAARLINQLRRLLDAGLPNQDY